ncbi:MAG: YncE family protein, partial [Anaerolineales bacterium]|nr:YncE family protein [Anaerolineales bacterium]
MNNRQAIYTMIFFTLLIGLSACSTSSDISPTPTATFLPPTATVTFTPSPIPPTFTPTPLTCLSQPGEVNADVVSTTNPPQ